MTRKTKTPTISTSFERVSLSLDRPFTISRGTEETAENVVVRITDGEYTGLGAAAPSAYYGETTATVEALLPAFLESVEQADDPFNRDAIERELNTHANDNPAAKAAVSIALHDLVAKRLDIPLYQLFGLDPEQSITSSFTIGLADPDEMAEKASEAVESGYTVLKTKLGTDLDRDVDIVASIRDVAPDARIRVDANEAWTPREAVEMSDTLAVHDIEFLEQPVPATNPEGLRFVYENASLPIAVDESCVTLPDVPQISDRSDIAVIKLMKCGGPLEALKMIHAARAHSLEIMLGCMVETNAAIAAACHLTPLVDYADLDGSLLLADDPYDGVPMPNGEIDLSTVEHPGTGAVSTEK
jgi:L-alanine-DL-glutamate epimerase-like enolase superfamily enzyme